MKLYTPSQLAQKMLEDGSPDLFRLFPSATSPFIIVATTRPEVAAVLRTTFPAARLKLFGDEARFVTWFRLQHMTAAEITPEIRAELRRRILTTLSSKGISS